MSVNIRGELSQQGLGFSTARRAYPVRTRATCELRNAKGYQHGKKRHQHQAAPQQLARLLALPARASPALPQTHVWLEAQGNLDEVFTTACVASPITINPKP